MKRSTLTRVLLLLALLLVPTASIHAQTSSNSDVVLFGQNYTLQEGETINGSIAVFGGNIEIQKDAEVNGSIAIFGGNLSIAEGAVINGDIAVFGGNVTLTGDVNGDMVLFGGQALLESEASIRNIATFGGQVTQEPGATVSGDITNNTTPRVTAPEPPRVPNVPNVPGVPDVPNVDVNVNPLWEVVSAFGRALAVAAVGMLLTLFLQPQLDRASSALVQQPLIAGGYGLLAIIVLPIVVVFLSITIILIPIALIAAMAIPLAWVFGMVVLGQEVGERFAKAINQIWAPVLTTGLGTFTLVLLTGLISLIPCIGWLGSFIISLLALGVTAMTRFGTFSPTGYTPAPSVDVIPPAS